ncbi:hypothetical protein NAT51_07150 [Flavobacterium amniphilum]|uniref:hypothetical protein n=1 Tax=Flavobacterium amniphilum TaxID=1834035 RepID=UPI00202A05C8|nr:hypothetical protein [Flavobacterium amniphilum]MCL9805291.1 hypothetical protein [Flavobacterium amniphilum]
MATYTMLGEYTCEKENSTQFRISFNIPDNCSYNLGYSSGKYSVEIQLNPKETIPSKVFIEQTEIVSAVSNCLDLRFEQTDASGIVIKKPSVIIND